MTDPDTQLELFRQAIRLVGGTREAARMLEINERTMVRLAAGQTPLHDGFMRDMAAALRRHIADCRALERRIDPAFSDNLAPDQPRADGRYKGASRHG
jgi:hypothetical protein